MRIKNWIKSVPTLVTIGTVLFLVLSVGSGLLFWGSTFARGMVHDQLAQQKIQFPAKGPGLDPKEFPGLQRYAGQAVDSGPKAKAYADEFIKVHLEGVADGKTYSQVSEESRADPKNAELEGQVQTLFRGETLRGLLLQAYAFWKIGQLARIGSFAAFGLAGLMAMLTIFGFWHLRKTAPDAVILAPVKDSTRKSA